MPIGLRFAYLWRRLFWTCGARWGYSTICCLRYGHSDEWHRNKYGFLWKD